MGLTAIRYQKINWDAQKLLSEAEQLARYAKYERKALNEEAPYKANCVTAMNYLIQKVAKTFLPLIWVENMPKKMVEPLNCTAVPIEDSEKLRNGDLLFVKAKGHKRSINHVAMVVDQQKQLVFHCCLSEKKGVIESLESFFKKYEQVDRDELLAPKNPRNDQDLAQLSKQRPVPQVKEWYLTISWVLPAIRV